MIVLVIVLFAWYEIIVHCVYVCLGQWGTGVSLLGFVRWPRRFRRGSRCLTLAAAPHRLPAPGRHWDSAQCDLPAAHCAGRGARQQPLPPGKHPRPSPRPDQSCFAARGCWRTRFPLQHSTTPSLLYWEEDPTRMPGDWSYRECLQRNGEKLVQDHNKFRLHTTLLSPHHFFFLYSLLVTCS